MTRAPGFAAIPNIIARSPDLHYGAKALFLALASHASKEGTAWPSQATLAAETGMGEGTVKRHLNALRDVGLIRWELRATANGRQRFFRVWRPGDPEPAIGVGTPAQGGQAISDPTGRATTATEQEPREQEPLEQYPAAAASEAPALFLVEAPERSTPPQTAQTLVARWVDGFRVSNDGQDPPGPLMKRVAGQMGRMAKGCSNDSDWGKAWQAAFAAGEAGAADAVPFLARQRSRYTKRNHDLDALQARSEGREVVLSPMARATIAMIRGEQVPPALEGGTR